VNKIYIDKEIDEVSFVRIVFIACGRNEVVVKNAATSPETAIQFMVSYIF